MSVAEAGRFAQAMATAQAAQLNRAYNPYSFAFALVGTSFIISDAWAVGAGAAMKRALLRGTYATLNLYF